MGPKKGSLSKVLIKKPCSPSTAGSPLEIQWARCRKSTLQVQVLFPCLLHTALLWKHHLKQMVLVAILKGWKSFPQWLETVSIFSYIPQSSVVLPLRNVYEEPLPTFKSPCFFAELLCSFCIFDISTSWGIRFANIFPQLAVVSSLCCFFGCSEAPGFGASLWAVFACVTCAFAVLSPNQCPNNAMETFSYVFLLVALQF